MPPVGSLTANEIGIRVKRQFGDEAGAQISDADILRWINDAIRDIALHNNLFQKKATAPTVTGQSEYTLPDDILTLRTVKYKGRTLRGMSQQEADEYIENNDSDNKAAGAPTHFWIFANAINLYPTPTETSGADLTLYYTKQSIPLVAMTEIPELPATYHNRIVEYCIAQAYELDSDMAGYQAKMSMFKDGLAMQKDNGEWSPTQYYPSITVMDEYDNGHTYWQGTH